MKTKPVLILSQKSDPHTIAVCQQLSVIHYPWVLFDPGRFPHQYALSGRLDNQKSSWVSTMMESNGCALDLETVGAIWNRRPGTYGAYVPASMETIEREFIQREAERGVGGILRSLPAVRWVNHPEHNRMANYKPYQLTVARQHGLSIPRTLVTSEPEPFIAFYEECAGDVIYKLMGDPVYVEHGTSLSTHTSMVPAAMLKEAHRIKGTTHLFQERIPKVCDLRIIIIGPHLFAAAIYPQSEKAQLDFRADYEHLVYKVYNVPEEIVVPLRLMMAHFQLVYAAIDMLLTPEGEHVFLELNPNGQFGFIETQTGYPLFQMMAQYLAYGE